MRFGCDLMKPVNVPTMLSMSKAEILEQLPKLTREERLQIVAKVREIDGDDWLDEGELSDEQKALIEARLTEHERNPAQAITWEQFEAQLNQRIAR